MSTAFTTFCILLWSHHLSCVCACSTSIVCVSLLYVCVFYKWCIFMWMCVLSDALFHVLVFAFKNSRNDSITLIANVVLHIIYACTLDFYFMGIKCTCMYIPLASHYSTYWNELWALSLNCGLQGVANQIRWLVLFLSGAEIGFVLFKNSTNLCF